MLRIIYDYLTSEARNADNLTPQPIQEVIILSFKLLI